MSRFTTCAFTGHREDKMNLTPEEWREIRKMIYDTIECVSADGIVDFVCGMAQGADLCFGECVLELKKTIPYVTLEAAIPYAGQSKSWSEQERARYDAILEGCNKVTVLQENYTRGCMMRRNEYMVDNANLLLAVYNGSSGGTRNTMLYAYRQGIRIIEIDIS